jgi:hypothetical protein
VVSCTKTATVPGTGQSGNVELQIQTKFSVTNGGCITASSASTVTVTSGSNLNVDFSVGTGPAPTKAALDGATISTTSVLTVTNVTSSHTLYLDNAKKKGTDVDAIAISVQ